MPRSRAALQSRGKIEYAWLVGRQLARAIKRLGSTDAIA